MVFSNFSTLNSNYLKSCSAFSCLSTAILTVSCWILFLSFKFVIVPAVLSYFCFRDLYSLFYFQISLFCVTTCLCNSTYVLLSSTTWSPLILLSTWTSFNYAVSLSIVFSNSRMVFFYSLFSLCNLTKARFYFSNMSSFMMISYCFAMTLPSAWFLLYLWF